MQKDIVVIAHNIRSAHNIGSLLRTCDGMGVSKVYITGYSPYPRQADDARMPHIADKAHSAISKTALGAEEFVKSEYRADVMELIRELKKSAFQIVGLEQNANSVNLPDFKSGNKVALLLGEEVKGIDKDLLALCDQIVEIPMLGKKESYNVVQATAMALYHLRFIGI